MAELKPCPFCGGNARISSDTEATKDSQGRLWAFTVVCDQCCASSGLTFKPEKAVEAWNRRMKDGERICPFDGHLVVCDSDCDHCDYAKMGEV